MEESHPAIIDKEIWEAVQFEMEKRRIFAKEHDIAKVDYATITNTFAGKIICGYCGSVFRRKVWNSTNELRRRIVWRCNRRYIKKRKKGCNNKHIDDKVLVRYKAKQFICILKNSKPIKEF